MRDKKKQRRWNKEHLRRIVGFRPVCFFDALQENLEGFKSITPDDFLIGGGKEPFAIYGSGFKVHVPRSLLKRARIDINRETGKIVSRGYMPYANK